MGLYGALRSGVSSLFANSQRMAMIADNIANVNTVGYKRVDARFSTFITQSTNRGLYNSGGVRSQTERENSQQGILEPTSFSTDFSITGSGFFVVTDAVQRENDGTFTNSGVTSYTRAGQFRMDRDGNLVNSDGQYLLSWGPDESTASRSSAPIFAQTSQVSDLKVVNLAQQALNPEETTRVDVGVNLNANTPVSGFSTAFSIQVPLIDKQGTPHTMDLTFVRPQDGLSPPTDVDNEWLMYANVEGDAQILTTGGGAIPVSVDGSTTRSSLRGLLLGSVTFDAQGRLQTVNQQIAVGTRKVGGTDIPGLTDVNANIFRVGAAATVRTGDIQETEPSGRFFLRVDFDGNTASADQSDRADILFNLGSVNRSDGVTQFGGSRDSTISTIKFLEQNGRLYTGLSGVGIADRGILEGFYDNGETRGLYQVPIFTFTNPNGLRSLSGNLFGRTRASGEPLANVSGSGGSGTVVGAAVEASATDIATEFSNMIVTQRAFSAATRIVTTTDEMLQELGNTIR